VDILIYSTKAVGLYIRKETLKSTHAIKINF